ncbi:hypothetical protein AI2642V1_2931 [Citrobacter freundii]|nr:hypothetical protein AI2642V1_2931 [Citrobacter freundii]CAH3565242.1 hypothetical protein AI2642V1_2931 [Citrobacter freundii]
MRQTINYLTDLLDSHRTLLAMSAPRSQRTFSSVTWSASCQQRKLLTGFLLKLEQRCHLLMPISNGALDDSNKKD